MNTETRNNASRYAGELSRLFWRSEIWHCMANLPFSGVDGGVGVNRSLTRNYKSYGLPCPETPAVLLFTPSYVTFFATAKVDTGRL